MEWGTSPPGDYLFLLEHGVPLAVIEAAVAQALVLGVTAERVLIADGHVEQDLFYRAVALSRGLPFVAAPQVARSDDPALALAAGLATAAPGAPYRFVAAPEGLHLQALLRSAGGRGPLPGLAITSPDRFHAAVLAADGAAVTAKASHGLPDADPARSFRDEATVGEVRALVGLAFLVAASLAAFPEPTLRLGQALAGFVFLGFLGIRVGAAAGAVAPPAPAPQVPDHALPGYAVLVPLHHESDDVLRPLVASLVALDYPRAKLDVVFLVEGQDMVTREALRRVPLPPFGRIVVCPAGAPKTKPRALNIGLQLARGDLAVVYDAEDRPDPDQLRTAAAAFSVLPPDVVCLQAALTIRNGDRCWLTRQFQLEYAHLFGVSVPGLAALGLPIPLGGTSNHFRREALERLGAWDAWNVTEDADLGFRIFAAGLRVAVLPSATSEEAPVKLASWFGQRRRWFKGWVQTAIVHLRSGRIRRPSPLDRLFVVLQAAGTVLSALVFPAFLWSWAKLAMGWAPEGSGGGLTAISAAVSVVVFASGAVHLLLAGLALHRRGVGLRPRDAVLLFPYLLLVSAAAACAVWELLERPFHWHKTDHGQAAEPRPRWRRSARKSSKAASPAGPNRTARPI